MPVDVVLPSGGRIAGDFAAEAGQEIKALIEIGGRSVLKRAVEALRATGRVERIVVVGPETVLRHHAAEGADAALPEGSSGPDNIFRGLDWLRANRGNDARALVVTTDLPFLTPEALVGFLDTCPADAEVCVPVIRREAFAARYPGSVNDYVRLGDGEWTIGGAFLLDTDALWASRSRIDAVFAARKSQLAMARLLGPHFVARFLTRRLTISDIERRCAHLLGCAGAAVHGCAPELAFDIDLPAHYRYAARASVK